MIPYLVGGFGLVVGALVGALGWVWKRGEIAIARAAVERAEARRTVALHERDQETADAAELERQLAELQKRMDAALVAAQGDLKSWRDRYDALVRYLEQRLPGDARVADAVRLAGRPGGDGLRPPGSGAKPPTAPPSASGRDRLLPFPPPSGGKGPGGDPPK